MALLLKTPDLQQVAQDVIDQFGPAAESADFFDNDALVIDFCYQTPQATPEALAGLLKNLQSCRLKPVAFRHADVAQAKLALSCGLVQAPDELLRSKATPANHDAAKKEKTAAAAPPLTPAPVSANLSTMVVDKPLRSGQKIYARGADLVVLAMVNQGAEVVADGNIHVYAPLRGKAMAGASGNTQARIFSLCLEPELISIAGVYRTSEHPLAAEVQGKPAQVRLSNDGHDKLLFEALKA